ncbi:MAG: hypothetical protein LBQ93_03780 [Treponema sp.]|jgi:hypothetical protein|nr:hypothetical protein [Treponema sp.]
MKTKMSKWITVKDGIVAEIHSSKTVQPDMTETPWNSGVKLGEKINWYDENFKRISNDELVKTGIRTDNRGTYYSKNDFRKTFVIRDLDIKIPDNVTNLKPIENEPCIWNGETWIIDEEAKAEIERYNSLLSDREIKEFVSGLAGTPNESVKMLEKGAELRKSLEVPANGGKQIGRE